MNQIGKNIQSVQRAIDILNCFTSNKDEISLTEISKTLGLNKSTVHGIINTLRNNEYIVQAESGKYALGPALLNKSVNSISLEQDMLFEAGHTLIKNLSNEADSNACLFFFQYTTPYLLCAESPENALYLFTGNFNNTPLYCSASGKLALSIMSEGALENYIEHCPFRPISPFTITDFDVLKKNLEKIRKVGYSWEQEEIYEGMSSVAVPIYKGDVVMGTVSLTNTSRHIERNFDRILSMLKETSSIIEDRVK